LSELLEHSQVISQLPHKQSAQYAVNRVEHFQELFNVDTEDLRLLLDPEYVEKEYKGDTTFLPPEDRYWQVLVYGASTEYLEDPDTDISFNLVMEFDDVTTETFLDVVYPHMVNRFEEEYSDRVDALQYMPPEQL